MAKQEVQVNTKGKWACDSTVPPRRIMVPPQPHIFFKEKTGNQTKTKIREEKRHLLQASSK